MAASNSLPIRFHEILNLTSNAGVDPKDISFATVTMDSSRWICVRSSSGTTQNVVIVDVANPGATPTRFVINADSAIMNPNEKVMALRAGQMAQIFHIDMKRKIKEYQLKETVMFWKWISANTVGIVTTNAVYHWSIEGSQDPVKVFDLDASIKGSQVINYRADSTQKWLVVVGIAQRDGRIAGTMQLYSVEKKVSQAIEGHAAAFANYTPHGAAKPSILFCFAFRNATASKLYILEVGAAPDSKFEKKAVDIYYPQETGAADFPVAMQIDEKNGVIFVITKSGYIHLFDLPTGTTIYMNRISQETIFLTAPHEQTNGIMGLNRQGQLLSVSVDESTVIPYICDTLRNPGLAISISSRANLPGAEDLFVNQFNALFNSGDYVGAAKVAAASPQGVLRNAQTIQRYQMVQPQPGQPQPLLQYFSTLLEHGQLNTVESLELVRPVLQQGKKDLAQKWLDEDKLGCSEELGDMLKQVDLKMALQVYYRADVRHKVVGVFAETGQYEKIVTYCQKVGYQPDWAVLLQNVLASNPQGAQQFASSLLQAVSGPMIDISVVINAFMNRQMVQEVTSLLLDYLKDNKPEQGALQTKLLEINLLSAPQVADAILGNAMFTYYDRATVAQLCENAGLYQRALEHYTELKDIKRVVVNTHAIEAKWLIEFFARLSVEDTMECLRALLMHNVQQNAQLVAQIATKYSEPLSNQEIVELFEEFQSFQGLFVFLQQMVALGSEDEEVHNKFIMAATKVGQMQDVERIVRESTHYDPEVIKNFFMQADLSDQLPLIVVCDRFDFIEDLTRYLYKNNMSQYIEAYVQKINPMNTPGVVGALLDVDCNEEYIKSLVMSVRNMAPIEELVAAVEQRNRLKLIAEWLEQRRAEGNQESALHDALAKIYIDDSSKDPVSFLQDNEFYDSRVVGKFAESRDPHLSFIAYKRGLCDQELLDVTNANGLFKNQARYLVERQSPELWAVALNQDNEFRQNVVDQVVQVALPESENPEEVSAAVKAFMVADLPNQLIELLEKIVLEHSQFANNRNLQNLLILTAIKADRSRVMGYVKRLSDYDAGDIATIAVTSELYEEGFVVYEKAGMNEDAIGVLIEYLDNNNNNDESSQKLSRAYDFAETCNSAPVWSKLARSQLDAGMTVPAIDSFLKAKDHEFFSDVIAAAQRDNLYEDLIRYLEMARRQFGTSKHPRIESELIYSFAKTNQLDRLEVFISSPNCAQIQGVGDRVFNEGMYEAAKLLFNNISNYPRLASTLVKLSDFQGAVEAARRAKSTRTWKEVNRACVVAREFELAKVCGLHIIQHGDELEELIRHYEARGHFEEIISLLDTGLSMEHVHVGMFTSLAILYSKYQPHNLMDHLRAHHAKINMPRTIRVCEENAQWKEAVFLYTRAGENESAVRVMIVHSADAWDSGDFKEIIGNVKNVDTLYRSLRFYLQEHPLLANDLLKSIGAKVDQSRVVGIAREMQRIPLIKEYLRSVQSEDIQAVNDALNSLYIEEEDYEALRDSISNYAHFDSKAMARRIERHELLEFRRIAAQLYKQNAMWEESMALSKKDTLWGDAMQSAADSDEPAVVEDLLQFFVESGRPDCFAACLFTCYHLVRPDVVLELAWKNKLIDYAMPFLVQVMRDQTAHVQRLNEAVFPGKRKKKTKAGQEDQDQDSHEAFNAPAGAALAAASAGNMMHPGVMMSSAGMMGVPVANPAVFATSAALSTPTMMAPGGFNPAMSASMMIPGNMSPGAMSPGAMSPGIQQPINQFNNNNNFNNASRSFGAL